MKHSLDLNPKPRDRCEHCGKKKGSHQAKSFHCPMGRPGRANTYQFSTVTKFTATPPHICATIKKALNAFETASRQCGLAQADGNAESIRRTQASYEEASMILHQKIARLEAKLAIAKLELEGQK